MRSSTPSFTSTEDIQSHRTVYERSLLRRISSALRPRFASDVYEYRRLSGDTTTSIAMAKCCCLPASMVSRRWKWPRVLLALFVLELAGTVASLALFGIADPNTFRTKMWQVGSDHGFNSSPVEILYAYANHRPIPSTPLVWSRTLTSYNIVISVLSMFVLLVKLVMFVMHIWYPLLGAASNLGITALWIVSVYGQAGPDHTDPKAKSNVAWYITKSCRYADARHWGHYCQMAKGTFAVSLVMLAIFFFNFVLAVYSLIPSKAERAAGALEYDDQQELADSPPLSAMEKGLEMQDAAPVPIPAPYTPRTAAFHTLSGSSASTQRPLPFRTMHDGDAPRKEAPKLTVSTNLRG